MHLNVYGGVGIILQLSFSVFIYLFFFMDAFGVLAAETKQSNERTEQSKTVDFVLATKNLIYFYGRYAETTGRATDRDDNERSEVQHSAFLVIKKSTGRRRTDGQMHMKNFRNEMVLVTIKIATLRRRPRTTILLECVRACDRFRKRQPLTPRLCVFI